MMSAPEFKIEKIATTGTLTDRVFEALTQHINNGDFKPGSRLPSEQAMAERFGVSRTVIRETISRLKSEGMVESRQGSGVFVRERNMQVPFRIDPSLMDSLESALQVVELRMSIEGEIAGLAAQRRTREQMETIEHALKQIELDELAGEDGVDADIEFHRSIAQATGNPHFPALIGFLFNFLHRATHITRRYEATKASLLQQVKEEHRSIVEAISRQDAEEARRAARRHMEGATRRLASIEDWPVVEDFRN